VTALQNLCAIVENIVVEMLAFLFLIPKVMIFVTASSQTPGDYLKFDYD
jgi:hypothetical protein